MSFNRILLILASLIMSIGGIVIINKQGFTMENTSFSALFLLSLLFFLFEKKYNSWLDRKTKNKHSSWHAKLENDKIVFPKGYYFRHGYIGNKKAILPSLIDEIRINTHPIAAKINSNELVFLVGLSKDKCIAFSKQHNIPVVSPVDTWSLICDDFLDTELDQKNEKETFATLHEHGIPETEVRSIRKQLNRRMTLNTYRTMEWIYYGQYDVLNQYLFLSKKRYWWTMEVALRGE